MALLYVGMDASDGRWRVVRCLLDSGRVDLDARDATGRTTMSYALESGWRRAGRVNSPSECRGNDPRR